MNNNDFRSFFPIFKKNPKLIYFDSAATSLKIEGVLNSIIQFYQNNGISLTNYNFLSSENIQNIVYTRKKTAYFLNASFEEIIFTKGTTESLNIVAQMLEEFLNPGDEIITSELEHNSSWLPWLKIAKKKQAKLVFIPLDEQNKITFDNFKKVLSEKTKIVALTHVSNVFGYETPIRPIALLAHEKKAFVILDAAQSIGKQKIDVKELDIDFMAFSAHKMYGPFGVGVIYGKKHLLKKLNPFFVGGSNSLVSDKNFFKNDLLFKELPYKFEAGTPNISGIISFVKSIEFIQQIGFEQIQKHNYYITQTLIQELKFHFPQIQIYNPDTNKGPILFNFLSIHPHDIESFLINNHIYLRTGKHCSDLIMQKIKQSSAIRVSIDIHNNIEDIRIFILSLKQMLDIFI
ncbi:aminotransferase class V-fold PLP-dependent enzyme [Candidatus Phytoplasma pini]|uniref:cysteine desulfurase n=1 Tax=Candidatus Phytoplasma pini TaxID=267362 RepID=A0A559KJW5_9MOLU|nr:aminotransferase class V-fold PLP-dependent enzyme [Candidatus Phytoplasma pini]TVY12421.1 cysteine desulfhydrase [Candidatus Phytoplasma pini]